MGAENTRWLVLGAAGLFVAYLVLKATWGLRPPLRGSPEARKRFAEARAVARAAGDGPARAEAWASAALVALGELGRPSLAARAAVQALEAAPGHPAALDTLINALHAARRHRALERWLWRALSVTDSPLRARAVAELIRLYEGPLRSPERAQALRNLTAP